MFRQNPKYSFLPSCQPLWTFQVRKLNLLTKCFLKLLTILKRRTMTLHSVQWGLQMTCAWTGLKGMQLRTTFAGLSKCSNVVHFVNMHKEALITMKPHQVSHRCIGAQNCCMEWRTHRPTLKPSSIQETVQEPCLSKLKFALPDRGGARGVPGGPLPTPKFCLAPHCPPKIFQVSFWKSYTDHWQLPLLQNWPLQWPPQMKMSGSAPSARHSSTSAKRHFLRDVLTNNPLPNMAWWDNSKRSAPRWSHPY